MHFNVLFLCRPDLPNVVKSKIPNNIKPVMSHNHAQIYTMLQTITKVHGYMQCTLSECIVQYLTVDTKGLPSHETFLPPMSNCEARRQALTSTFYNIATYCSILQYILLFTVRFGKLFYNNIYKVLIVLYAVLQQSTILLESKHFLTIFVVNLYKGWLDLDATTP